jgi:hypothetical protein
MVRFNRRTAPRVVRGKVQRKNRWSPTPNYYNSSQDRPVVDRRRPGRLHRHILYKQDVLRFIDLLPDWAELSIGLNAVVLAPAGYNVDGWHRPGVVAVCAWRRELWYETDRAWFEAHRPVLERIGVPCEDIEGGDVLCQWTEGTIRAYQLLHVLLHELGHHRDRMTTRSKKDACRGESFAEQYALDYADRIWDRYVVEFGPP